MRQSRFSFQPFARHDASRPPRSVLARLALTMVAAVALVAGVFGGVPPGAEALPRGEAYSFPGGLVISNFVMPNGKRAYCIEVSMAEPTGAAWSVGHHHGLPERAGMHPVWKSEIGMRRMNFLIMTHGQSKNAWSAAAVQLTIWRMRENFGSSNGVLNQKMRTLQSSQVGRNLIARSDAMYEESKRWALPPEELSDISGELSIGPDPQNRPGYFRVAYPKGAGSLSVTGGVFVRNRERTLGVDTGAADARYVIADRGAKEITVQGSWHLTGRAGWAPYLEIFNTATSSGGVGQRVAMATGKMAVPELNGAFADVTATPPAPAGSPPEVSTQAQPSAEVGGTMRDTINVNAREGTTLEMWPGATASHAAYLEPTAGAVKYSSDWQPVLGDPYEAQAEDPETGEPLWHTWWADEADQPLLDMAGAPIAAFDAAGQPTAGVAANGKPYPITRVGENGEPVRNDRGEVEMHTATAPVMERRRDPVTWNEGEISAMNEAQRCLAQPVHVQEGMAVPGVGSYESEPVTVRSSGTINWVERIYSGGAAVHEGECGIANERTKIGQPGVETQAPERLTIGDMAYDTATVSGSMVEGATYTLRFEAFAANEETTCTAENRVFRSERVAVNGPGEIASPRFLLRPENLGKIWWVETLEVDSGKGPVELHRGTCGLPHETTEVGGPSAVTKSLEKATVGDALTDTAILTGSFATNEGATWEIEFRGYRAHELAPVSPVGIVEPGDSESSSGPQTPGTSESQGDEPPPGPGTGDETLPPAAQCTSENLLFEVPAVAVTGPGELTSAPVIAQQEWKGAIWWVESLWLTQDGKRSEYSRGECGLANETTLLSGPTVTTTAVSIALVGDEMTDVAEIGGELTERDGVAHELVFAAYRGDAALTGSTAAACTPHNEIWRGEAVAVTGPGKYESPALTLLPPYGDTVWWVEELWQVESLPGDESKRTKLHQGKCGIPNETTTVQSPTVTTTATPMVAIGDELFDTATVEGPVTQNPKSEVWLRFDAYKRGADRKMRCTPESTIPELKDATGVRVRSAGKYESKRVRATKQLVGLGGYVETLVLKHDGKEYLMSRGGCDVQSENFEVLPPTTPPPPTNPDLPKTGTNPGAAITTGLVFAVAALAAAMAANHRRRHRKIHDLQLPCSSSKLNS